MRPAISSEKNPATPSRNKYNASTRVAIVDALSGNSGGISLFSDHDENERAERQDGRGAGDAQRPHHDETVAAGHRVVVVAVEQQLIDRVADFAGGGFDQG